MAKNGQSAQQKFVDTALTLFSERGFYGVSLADVGKALGLTKQSVLYHFATKEALYSEVLRQLSERFGAIVSEAKAHPGAGEERLEHLLNLLFDHMQTEPRDARVIARELLDNLERAETSRVWYLKDFLDECTSILSAHPGWSNRSLDEQTAGIYQMIGAINYLAISGPTLKGIWGAKRTNGMARAFLPTLLGQMD